MVEEDVIMTTLILKYDAVGLRATLRKGILLAPLP